MEAVTAKGRPGKRQNKGVRAIKRKRRRMKEKWTSEKAKDQ